MNGGMSSFIFYGLWAQLVERWFPVNTHAEDMYSMNELNIKFLLKHMLNLKMKGREKMIQIKNILI